MALLAGCAAPVQTDASDASDASDLQPAPRVPAPVRSGEASCARDAAAQQPAPTPRRGDVPADAVPGAEACVQQLRRSFNLLTAGGATALAARDVDAVLHSAGLTAIVVREGPAFAASTGYACVYGPDFALGPLAADGSCPP